MSSNYPKAWRQILDTNGTVLYHLRRCGNYFVRPEPTVDDPHAHRGYHIPEGIAGTWIPVTANVGLSAAMSACRLHKDAELELEK
jgi:hypothetical protein